MSGAYEGMDQKALEARMREVLSAARRQAGAEGRRLLALALGLAGEEALRRAAEMARTAPSAARPRFLYPME